MRVRFQEARQRRRTSSAEAFERFDDSTKKNEKLWFCLFHFFISSLTNKRRLPPLLDAHETSLSISRDLYKHKNHNRVYWLPQPSESSSSSTSNRLFDDAIIDDFFNDFRHPPRGRPRPRPRRRRRGSVPMARPFLRSPGLGEERLAVVWR